MQEYRRPQRGRPIGATSFDPASALAFGTAVRNRRLEIGLSQEQLALNAQVERSHMGKIERGQHLANFALIVRIAAALGTRPGDLVDRAVELLEH